MRTRRSVLVGGLLLALAPVLPAAGAIVQLTGPGLGFGPEVSPAEQEKVLAVLQRKDCTFVDGYIAHPVTSIRYRGGTEALNGFLEGLAARPGVTVAVSLKKLPDEVDWQMTHTSTDNRFLAEVNLASPRLDLEKLVIPEAKSPRTAR